MMLKQVITGLDYDDVLVVPGISTLNSRSDVNVFSQFVGQKTRRKMYPIFSAPMKEISGVDLVMECSKNRVVGILHKFNTPEVRKEQIKQLGSSEEDFGVAIGLNGASEIELAKYAEKCGASIICVDIANGYIPALHEFVKTLSKTVKIPIMTGNVVTPEGVNALMNSSCSYIRVGIGSGTLCSTRENTGVGIPQITALAICQDIADKAWIVSDGGINSPARAVKSFVAGADFVMIGSMLAYANEAENKNGVIYGMASRKLQEDVYGAVKSVEGIEKEIDPAKKRPLVDIIEEFVNGIKSACTYLDCSDYTQLKTKEFYLVGTGKNSLK